MKSRARLTSLFGLLTVLASCHTASKMLSNDKFLPELLSRYPQYFDSILINRGDFRVQVIYTQIDRNRNGKPILTDFYYSVDANEYFYPASTIKLPIALLALQKLNELKVTGLDKNTTMITETDDEGQTAVYNDPTTPDGRPTIAHYIKKILLVSDNEASNRLYEFLGQEYINNTLHKMGYDSVQILHRLNVFLTEEQNRHTNPVNFYDSNSKIIYSKPGLRSKLVYAKRNTKMGKGFIRGDQLIYEPFDFSKKNRLPLADLHNILKSVIFPSSVKSNQRFNLTKEDHDFLLRYLSMTPRESRSPFYDSTYHNSYVKFLLYGRGKTEFDPTIRSFNKVGDAYGFLIDAAYIVDLKNNLEFMLSAIIYCNSDEIFNDDKYDYDKVGYPFMKNLGRVIYEYELKRKRKFSPDLSSLHFDYTN